MIATDATRLRYVARGVSPPAVFHNCQHVLGFIIVMVVSTPAAIASPRGPVMTGPSESRFSRRGQYPNNHGTPAPIPASCRFATASARRLATCRQRPRRNSTKTFVNTAHRVLTSSSVTASSFRTQHGGSHPITRRRFLLRRPARTTRPSLAGVSFGFADASYLAGILAAGLTHTDRVGVIGSTALPAVVESFRAFALGARDAKSGVKVIRSYIGNWDDRHRREGTGAGADLPGSRRAASERRRGRPRCVSGRTRDAESARLRIELESKRSCADVTVAAWSSSCRSPFS